MVTSAPLTGNPTGHHLKQRRFFMSEKILDPLAKKYRRRLITNIVLIASAIAIIFFIILAYIGTLVGNYTINMKNKGLALAMADNREFKNATSRLRASSLPYTLPIGADDLPEDTALDDTDGTHNGVVNDNEEHKYYGDGKYLAYTFYMRNYGELPIAYEHLIYIDELFKDQTGNGIDTILRVKFFENRVTYNDDGSVTTAHDGQVYAKTMTYADTVVTDKGGENVYVSENRECISKREQIFNNGQNVTVCAAAPGRPENAGRAEPFYSDTEIVHVGADGTKIIYPEETIRFTIVAWLEGEDPDCNGETPENPSITLASKIIALKQYLPEEQENTKGK